MELSQSEIDQILSDGTGMLMSATQLHHPPCLVCGKPQSRYYVALREIDPARHAVCIPCAEPLHRG